ncbi:SusC/RagA family TonB-linked outer membrane protein [Flavobacterium circumlabens]|uniref:SusC/RagA family TonB-linked outer membrane protein n=1 Tax=Flavobacterium circumlabens TaxID=2133765 RepID=A0A4Y7UBT1_9FLAO|nr:SusC/RagA family TonB-linked outer membrane protein [Flavobacterium circumlabens]TCN56450.1 TonB-linked SusC/RagA family outer membrane protein [Flavobacterium circumlabens]TEB43478.1 SusC/RagA family TonB-linked outer membrane protein [Flavobacterium circumlabens]
MKQKLKGLMSLFFALVLQFTFAQEKTVTGKVSDNAGMPLLGVSVLVKGTKAGTQTDFDGKYAIRVALNQVLVFSYIGMKTQEVPASTSIINVKLIDNAQELEGVVVTTALGIKRDRKSLGYATQEVNGEDLTKVNTGNVSNSIAGKVAGIEIKRSGNIGGSTNVVIRGSKSITGNNQALWVVDGIPLNNDNSNSADQKMGRSGFDYGNAASDINPDDIETINVLKGAAASALYGSRAGNGVIIVTTKKGKKGKGLGISFSSGISTGTADKKTLPQYQKQYGGGDSSVFSSKVDLGQGEFPTIVAEDASWGPAFNSSQRVYNWNSYYPELATYGKTSSWVAAKNDPISFFNHSTTYTNNIAISNGNENGTFRFGYTNFDQTGILPNSSIKKNNFNFSGSYKVSSKTEIAATANYIASGGTGLNDTGYSDNIMGSFRQWWHTDVDLKEQEHAYKSTGKNITWNPRSTTNTTPLYWDNPYFGRYENYNNFSRDRFFGNFTINTEITNWFSVTGRGAVDTYAETQEERVAVGSGVDSNISGYSRYDKRFREINLDLLLNFKAKIAEDFNFRGLLGASSRRSRLSSIRASTNGGLLIPKMYALSNSVSGIENPREFLDERGVNSAYASASFDYKETFFIEGTFRIDESSTLPAKESKYNYPSVTGTYIFSKHLNLPWLEFGKLRVNFAQTGNDAEVHVISPVYTKGTNFNDNPIFSNENIRKNPNLKSETIEGQEAGIELQFFKRRIGLEASVYKSTTKDLIMDITTGSETGYSGTTTNAGKLTNKGVELTLTLVPVKTQNFSWTSKINWNKNDSKVVSLADGLQQVVIGTFNQGTSLNAIPGQPLGVIKGSGYKYLNGERVVLPNGNYDRVSNVAIGNVTPDWTGGINNIFNYKRLTFSFLIDIKKGGDVFSLDQAYGQANGLYQNTVGTNDLGNPIRNKLTDARPGGQILPAVQADGTPNNVRAAVTTDKGESNLGYKSFPNQAFVYDASYVKLREVSIAYQLPPKLLEGTFMNNVTFAANGSNIWIIHKNVPYADPEAGFSSGNFQGFQTGVMPSVREISFSVKVQF